MVKASCFDKNGFKKGAWSEEEDEKLRAYITRYGHWNWNLLPKFAGLSRNGKSCKLRWMNYLRPDMKHGNFTIEEDNIIVDLHNKLGNKWSAIATKLPGRSDNEIKNRWNTDLKKRTQEDQIMQQTTEPDDLSIKPNNYQANGKENANLEGVSYESGSSSSSCAELSSDCAVLNDISPKPFDHEEFLDDFWKDPFLGDIFVTFESCW